MRSTTLRTAVLLLALPFLFAARPTAAADFAITAVTGHAAVYRWVRMIPEALVPALDEALAGSGHSVTVIGQYGGAIAGVGEELETIGAGLAEFGTCQAVFDPAKLALQNVTYYTPFVTDQAALVAQVIDDFHREDPRMTAAYTDNGVVYLGAPIVIDDYLLLTDFPVDSLADLKGKRIAAPGAAVNWLAGTGAVGVSGNLTTYYNDIENGVHDGVLVFASAAAPAKLYEVAPYVTQVGLGAQFAAALCANRAWHESLPPAVRSALGTAAAAASDWYRAELDAAVAAAFARMSSQGATISAAPPSMRRAWAQGMDDAAGKWMRTLNARGLPASEFLADYMDAMRAAGAMPLRHWDR